MKGQVLDYSIQENKGIITVEDGSRYTFEGKEWKEASPPAKGVTVDFEIGDNNSALGVYKALKAQSAISLPKVNGLNTGGKKKVVAGLLAIFLGGFGAHKFYLGMVVPAVIYLFGSFICSILAGITDEAIFLLPAFIIGLFSLIDAILYLTKSDDDFQTIYVDEKKQWF